MSARAGTGIRQPDHGRLRLPSIPVRLPSWAGIFYGAMMDDQEKKEIKQALKIKEQAVKLLRMEVRDKVEQIERIERQIKTLIDRVLQ